MTGEMGPRLEERAKETAKAKARDDLKNLEAEERRIERALFQKCDHDFEDVTEERRRLVEMRGGLPGWVKALIEKKDPRAMRMNPEAYKSSRYEKCITGCGLLRVTRIA